MSFGQKLSIARQGIQMTYYQTVGSRLHVDQQQAKLAMAFVAAKCYTQLVLSISSYSIHPQLSIMYLVFSPCSV